MSKKFILKKLYAGGFNDLLEKADINSFSPFQLETNGKDYVLVKGNITPVECTCRYMNFNSENIILDIEGSDLKIEIFSKETVLVCGLIDAINYKCGR